MHFLTSKRTQNQFSARKSLTWWYEPTSLREMREMERQEASLAIGELALSSVKDPASKDKVDRGNLMWIF